VTPMLLRDVRVPHPSHADSALCLVCRLAGDNVVSRGCKVTAIRAVAVALHLAQTSLLLATPTHARSRSVEVQPIKPPQAGQCQRVEAACAWCDSCHLQGART
jgi:hypothetical protein